MILRPLFLNDKLNNLNKLNKCVRLSISPRLAREEAAAVLDRATAGWLRIGISVRLRLCGDETRLRGGMLLCLVLLSGLSGLHIMRLSGVVL